MDQITDLLKSGSTFPAWKLLYSMSDYTDLDAGISRELAHRIEAIWNSDKTQNGLEIANAKLRDSLDTQIHNADMTADDLHQQDLEENSKPGNTRGGNSNGQSSSSTTNSPLQSPTADPVAAEASILPTMSGALQRKMELTDEYLQTLESRANIQINLIKEHKMDLDAQTDFASYIDNLYKTRRYYQVIIAADFYRALFNQDEYPVDMQNEVSSSLEINEQVAQSLEAFKFDAGQGRISAAATELQTAFVDNEFHPGLQGLQRDEKQRVGDYLAKIDVLKNQLESRVFEEVPAQLASIQKLATDFDATKPLALVNGVKLESELRLGKAKLLAQQGELTDAMKEFSNAAELWPGNPDLQTASKTFFGTEDAVHQNTDDFDRDFNAGNYREIATKAVQYGAAVQGDPARKQQLTDAITKVQKAEAAETEANMRVMNGDVDGAWETIETAGQRVAGRRKAQPDAGQPLRPLRRFCQRDRQGARRAGEEGIRLQPDLVRQRAELLPGQHHRQRRGRRRQQADPGGHEGHGVPRRTSLRRCRTLSAGHGSGHLCREPVRGCGQGTRPPRPAPESVDCRPARLVPSPSSAPRAAARARSCARWPASSRFPRAASFSPGTTCRRCGTICRSPSAICRSSAPFTAT